MDSITIHILKLLAGVGLFLFAMFLIEESLKNISGRNFKLFLQRITKNRVGAVLGGTIITGIFQSSSMVSMMVLAFVGAGVFTMKNALAIILGANLGTTLDSWLVATLGFKVNIEIFAYPSVCLGGLLLVLFSKRSTIKYFSYFLFGFGLLFIGLSFMKTSMEAEVKEFDVSKYSQLSLGTFLLVGFVLTLLVQSSSVTMALALSAIHSEAIDILPAAAIVLGSETGTTIKVLLSAIGGNSSKKRVVLGNLVFNICLTILAFSFLKSILFLISDIFGIKDPLISLVTFSSLVNLFGVIIFIPFLNIFAKFLENFFNDHDLSAAAFIQHANVSEPETAMDLFRKETEYFIYNSMLYNLGQFGIRKKIFSEHPYFKIINERKKYFSKTSEEKYEFIRQLQGELQAFYMELRARLLEKNNAKLNQYISSVRNANHSVKSIKDIRSNISNLSRSSKEVKFDFFIHHKKEIENLYTHLNKLMMMREKVTLEVLIDIYDQIHRNYSSSLNNFYKNASNALIEDIDFTIVINFNRELFTSNKSILLAIKDFLLEEKLANNFDEVNISKL